MNSKNLYIDRPLSDAYPDLAKLAHESFSGAVQARTDDSARILRLMTYLGRLVSMEESTTVLVLGCGPHPQAVSLLSDAGHQVTGVEPVESFVKTAQEFTGDSAQILVGAAENIPLPDESQKVVLFESVAEHVDSIRLSFSEIFRVLAPGGVLFVSTTNRNQFSWRGNTGEYHVPFFNWLPGLVKECYVHDHLHFRPHLANYTERPAVHWFTYKRLCDDGRDVGFARFYSLVDLMLPSDESISKHRIRRWVLNAVQRNPWARAVALNQMSGHIFMVKR